MVPNVLAHIRFVGHSAARCVVNCETNEKWGGQIDLQFYWVVAVKTNCVGKLNCICAVVKGLKKK